MKKQYVAKTVPAIGMIIPPHSPKEIRVEDTGTKLSR
jgi:hypothetical protein